jgi:hypothetical protein
MLPNRLVPLAIIVSAMLHGAAEAATVQHAEALRAYRVGTRLSDADTRPATAGATTVAFNAFSRDFVLELEPNGRLAAMQRRLGAASGTAAYRGRIAGRAGSWARLVLTPDGPSGIVFDGETLYGIETDRDRASGPTIGAPAIFRLADVYFAPGELGCEIGAVAIDGEQALQSMAQEFTALAASGATLNLDLGAVADFEFAQNFGANAEAALLTRFNNVDGLFSEQLGVQITVAEVDIFTTANDPFTATAANALLDELANYRGATPTQDAQGLTHLFTGRNLDGSTVGIAFFGALCATRRFGTRSFGSGLSEARRGALIDSLVAAHEIGHNFGAPHDGDANGSCASTPATFLMAPSINGSNQFSACSIAQIQTEIASASCLTPIGAANMAVTLPPRAQPAHAGVSFNHAVTVVNQGADAATNVTVAANTESGLTIVAADAGASSCAVQQTSASCALGTVSGGAARTVALTLRAANVGTFDLTSTVTADADADSGDDSATIDVAVVPLVDLVWSGSSPGVQLDAQTTINAVLDNTADFAASGVAVTAALTAGLRPDSASLAGTVCTITGQSITCPTRSLAAQTNVALVVAATGIAAGNQQLTLSAAASEAERTPADNQLAIAVNVSAPQQAGDGGGGALPWWVVVALLAARGLRGRELPRRRRHA